MLVKFYPGIVVPPLPPPTNSKEKVFGYQKKLQHFLLDCYRCPELKNSTYYENFLSYSNLNDFETFLKNSITSSKPKSLSHIINMTGIIETLYSENIEKYGEGLQNYIAKTTNHLKQQITIHIQGQPNLKRNQRSLRYNFGFISRVGQCLLPDVRLVSLLQQLKMLRKIGKDL